MFVDSTQLPSSLDFIHSFFNMCIHLGFIYKPLGEHLLCPRRKVVWWESWKRSKGAGALIVKGGWPERGHEARLG